MKHDGYLCLDPVNGRIYMSRDVKFLEEDFKLNKHLFKDEATIILGKHPIVTQPFVTQSGYECGFDSCFFDGSTFSWFLSRYRGAAIGWFLKL